MTVAAANRLTHTLLNFPIMIVAVGEIWIGIGIGIGIAVEKISGYSIGLALASKGVGSAKMRGQSTQVKRATSAVTAGGASGGCRQGRVASAAMRLQRQQKITGRS